MRGTNWIGDAVMTIPALRELRRIFAGAHITLSTRGWAEGIFADADFIDEILPLEKANNSFRTVYRQAKIWRERKFEAAVLFTNSFESALLASLAKVPKRFGYATEKRSFLLTESFSVPTWKNSRHEIYYYLNLVAEIENALSGATKVWENEPLFELRVSEERRTEARVILETSGVDLSKKTVALGVGSTNSRAKRWHAESYARLNDRLQTELNANVILVGAADEAEVSDAVVEKAKLKPFVLTGKTNLSQAVAVLSEIDLLVANDMGLAHVAPATGTKTLVIFGPTNDKTTRPIGSEIIRKNVECSPCMLRDCPIDHRCMTRISPDEVFEIAEKLLNTKAQGTQKEIQSRLRG
ncbi:MAG TPA: lipopolysaccharide heptosyltransferase II [Pyrinomonadaceae bacterium]|nr:lipopolysaccharide heptosyltransferase II [Pyrinomonadaceae bacterium]